jgi:hypothetical protein
MRFSAKKSVYTTAWPFGVRIPARAPVGQLLLTRNPEAAGLEIEVNLGDQNSTLGSTVITPFS